MLLSPEEGVCQPYTAAAMDENCDKFLFVQPAIPIAFYLGEFDDEVSRELP